MLLSGKSLRKNDFKNWLVKSWLNKDIIFDTLYVEGNVRVDLVFNYSDNCTERWKRIKLMFDSSGQQLEDYIFSKTAFLLECPFNKLEVRIHGKVDEYSESCFARIISFRDSLKVKHADCKDLSSRTGLEYKKFNSVVAVGHLQIDSLDQAAENILDLIAKKSAAYYAAKRKAVSVYRENVNSPY